MNKKIRNNLNK